MTEDKNRKNLEDEINRKEIEQIEEFSFDDLDKEVGLGDILKEKESLFMSILKKGTFVLVVVTISVIVFFASFTIGKMMFLAENTAIKNVTEVPVSPTKFISNNVIEEENKDIVAGLTAQNTENVSQEKAVAPTPQAKETPKKVEPAPEAVKPVVKEPVVKKEEPTLKKETKAESKPVAKAEAKKIVPVVKEVAKVDVKKNEPKAEVAKPAASVVTKAVTTKVEAKPVVAKPVEKAKVEAAAPTIKYMLVAGSFSAKKNADICVEGLKKLSFTPETVSVTVNNTPWFRVIAGVYSSTAELNKKKELLKAKGYAGIFSLPYNK